jgi:hypothetical protein
MLALVIGWPAVLAALITSAVAIVARRPALLFVGFLLAAPLLLYLTATPRFQVTAPVAGVLFAGAPVALRRDKVHLSIALVAPFALLVAWVATMVILN